MIVEEENNNECSSGSRNVFSLRKTNIKPNINKIYELHLEKRPRNPDMINYLKSLLTRLQSPISKKRTLKT